MAELFSFMAEHPEARLIAGATELGLDITKRFRKFPDADFGRSSSGADRKSNKTRTNGKSAARRR